MPVWIVCYVLSVAGRVGDLLAYEWVCALTIRYRSPQRFLVRFAPC